MQSLRFGCGLSISELSIMVRMLYMISATKEWKLGDVTSSVVFSTLNGYRG